MKNKIALCLLFIFATRGIMAVSATDNIDPFQKIISYLQTTIETQQKALDYETPEAKNVELQAEISKVFSVYKTVIQNSIINLGKQKSLVQELSSPLTSGVSTDPTKLEEFQQKLAAIQNELDGLKVEHQQNEQQIQTLQGRLTELTTLDQPAAVASEWWDQFGTSLGSSS